MAWIPETMYVAKLADIVNEYNNTYHSTTKRNPVDTKSSRYFDFDIRKIDEDHKFKINDYVRIPKCIIILFKVFLLIWFAEVLQLKKLKILCSK